MKTYMIFIIVLLSVISCGKSEQHLNSKMPPEMIEVLEAHGGTDRWVEKNTLAFKIENKGAEELHEIDLTSRKVKITSSDYTIGFDGKEVWVSPNKAAFSGSSARFYHNLLFYFYAMPFVLADPGINYTQMEPIVIKGKTFERLKISYDQNIGDAPKDEYIICFDPETKKMEWLFYTVTYFSGEMGTNYNAIHYDSWQEVNGLILPEKLIGYKTDADSIGDKRYERTFYDVSVSKEKLMDNAFEMPPNAEIDSLKTN